MDSYTLRRLFDTIGSALYSLYPPTEVRAIRKLLFEKVAKTPEYRVHLDPNTEMDRNIAGRMLDALGKLKAGKPVQYVLGEADFMGLVLEVNPGVLIPRPETEELVCWIVDSNRGGNARILDIGTGSGCIAISLARHIPEAQVSALDISQDAIDTAGRNAARSNVDITLIKGDILGMSEVAGAPFDIIVSNPPYVRESEKPMMSRHVTDFEPHRALFVSDSNPLLFYRAIVRKAHGWLCPHGQIYLEINEAMGNEVKSLLEESGFGDVQIRQDINGKNRMAFGRKPDNTQRSVPENGKNIDKQEALVRLQGLCARQEKYSAGLRQKMLRWGMPPADIAWVMDHLAADSFVDDARFAAMFVRDKSRIAKWGRAKIAAALRAKAIPADVIADALAQVDPNTERLQLENLIDQKRRQTKAKSEYELRNKLIRFGVSRGFGMGLVIDVVNRATGE